MSARTISAEQPESFEFTSQNMAWANDQIKKYPEGKQASAVIPLLWRAQEQHDGWLPQPAIDYIAGLLDMAPIRVMEVATFYTMFNMAPVGKFFIQLCGTTPCLLRGSDKLVAVLKERIGGQNHVTSDGMFSWLEVECLGACSNAPMVQINQDYFEDLNAEMFTALLDDLQAGRDVTPGPQNGRSCSCPDGGATSLTDASLYEGKDDVASAGVGLMSADNLSNMAGTNAGDVGGPGASGADGSGTEAPETKTLADFGGNDRAPDDEAGQSGGADFEQSPEGENVKPQGLTEARGGKGDDLKKISGVGPKLEETLNSLGIFHFDQIAVWTRENVAWVDNYLSFKGRIDREDWIQQATILASAAEINSLTDEKAGDD